MLQWKLFKMKKNSFISYRKHLSFLRIHWKLSTILKASMKECFLICVFFYKCIQCTMRQKKNVGKFPADKINGKKNVLFLSLPSTHHRFTFNSRFLYELKHKVRLSIFNSVSFLSKFTFLFNKTHGLFDFKASLFLSKLK